MNALDWFWVFANFLMPAWALALALAMLPETERAAAVPINRLLPLEIADQTRVVSWEVPVAKR